MNQLCRLRKSTPHGDRGAALLIAIIVIAVLTVIGITVLHQSRSGQRQAGLDKTGRELRSAAEQELNRVADWLQYWFKNTLTGGDPKVFVENAGTTPWTYKDASDNPNYKAIALDPTSGTPTATITKMLQDFRALLDDPTSYGAGWTNPSAVPGVTHGVFAQSSTANGRINYTVWGEPQFDDPGCTISDTGITSPNIACIQSNFKYSGNPATQALKLVLRARATLATPGGSARTIDISRPVWLVGAQNSNFSFGILAGKVSECVGCHMQVYGSFGMASNISLKPISAHMAGMRVWGSGMFAGNMLLDMWPDPLTWATMPLSQRRNVRCGHAQHPCADSDGDGLWELAQKCGDTSDPNCFYKDPTYGNVAPSTYLDGEAFNGSLYFGDIQQGISNPTLLSKPQEIRDFNKENKGFCPHFDPGCTSDEYVTNNFYDVNNTLAQMIDNDGRDTYLKVVPSSGPVDVYFSTGKTKSTDPTDEMREDGTIANMSPWITATGPKASNVIRPGFSDVSTVWGSQTRTTGIKALNDSTFDGVIVDGNMIIDGDGGEIEMQGTIKVIGDLILNNVKYLVPVGKIMNWIVLGNVYITGDLIDKNLASDIDMNNPADLPANGKNYTLAETPNASVLTIGTPGAVVLGNINSGNSVAANVAYLNLESSATIETLAETGSENFVNNGLYNKDVSSLGATTGFYVNSNDSTFGRTARNELIDIVYAVGGPTGVGAMASPPANIVTNGMMPLGARQDDPANYDVNDSVWQDNGNTWIDGKELIGPKVMNVAYLADSTGETGVHWGPGLATEHPDFVSKTHEVHALIQAGAFFTNTRSNGTAEEGDLDFNPPIKTTTGPLELSDFDKDGVKVFGALLGTGDAYTFAPGGMHIFASPKTLQSPLFQQILRDVVSGDITVH